MVMCDSGFPVPLRRELPEPPWANPLTGASHLRYQDSIPSTSSHSGISEATGFYLEINQVVSLPGLHTPMIPRALRIKS